MRTCLVAGLLFPGASGVSSQSAPAFDVVSVRLSPPWQPGMTGGMTMDATHFTLARIPVRSLIISEYDLPVWALPDVEPRVNSDGYDMRATMPPNTPKEQFKPMLRTLLADRFKLRFH